METLAGVLQDEVHIHALGLVGSSLVRVRVARAVGSRPGNDPGLPACMNTDPKNAIILMLCTFTPSGTTTCMHFFEHVAAALARIHMGSICESYESDGQSMHATGDGVDKGMKRTWLCPKQRRGW